MVKLLDEETLLMIRGVAVDQVERISTKEGRRTLFDYRPEWALFSSSGSAKNVYGKSFANRKKAFNETLALGQRISGEPYGVRDIEEVGEDDNSEEKPGQVTPLDVEEDTPIPGLNPEDPPRLFQILNEFRCLEYISRFFITGRGYIGRGPIATREGDHVVIFLGAKVPYILRKNQNVDEYRIIGECCKLSRSLDLSAQITNCWIDIQGIMRGALMQDVSKTEIQDFVLR